MGSSSCSSHDLEHIKERPKSKKMMTSVNDHLWLKLILLITEFKLSCYMAAKVLNLPYTNAKVIYRVFRSDKRIVQNSRNPTGNH